MSKYLIVGAGGFIGGHLVKGYLVWPSSKSSRYKTKRALVSGFLKKLKIFIRWI